MMAERELTLIAADLKSALREGAQALGVHLDQLECEELGPAPGKRLRFRVYVRDPASRSTEIDRILDQIDWQIAKSPADSGDGVTGKAGNDFLERVLENQHESSGHGEAFELMGDVEIARIGRFDQKREELYTQVLSNKPLIKQEVFARLLRDEEQEFHKLVRNPQSGIEFVRLSEASRSGVFLRAAYPGWLVYADGELRIIPLDCDAELSVEVISPLRAELRLFPAAGSGKACTQEDILKLLKSKGICYGIQEEGIKRVLSYAGPAYAWSEPFPIALGKAPKPARHAFAELLFPQKEDIAADFEILPDGRVDYRKVMHVPTVRRGDEIARIHRGEEGVPGQDIFGALIPVDPPIEHPLIPGENVETDADGRIFRSLIDGMPVIQDETLSVYPQFVVRGHVDYHTGNIDFRGNVLIQGSVLSGFEVRASGDIVIQGHVESAVIQAGRNLLVSGGVVGEGKAPIQCGGVFSCQFAQKAWVESIGDIVIHSSCMHSRVHTLGHLILKSGKGVLVGGQASAFRGGVIRQIGSPVGTPTRLVLGEDFLCSRRVQEEERQLGIWKQSLSKLEDYLFPLLKKIGNGYVLREDQKFRLKQIIAKRDELLAMIKSSQTKIKRLQALAPESAECSLRILDILYSDVQLRMAGLPVVMEEHQTRIILEVDRKNRAIIKKSLGLQKE